MTEQQNIATPILPTIMLVEDEKYLRDLVKIKLEKLRYTVIACEDGETAIKILETNSPDLILLDINLPGIDGFEVCKIIKKNPRTSLIPIIMLTAASGLSDKLKGLNLGGDDYLVKPIDMQELITRIHRMLERIKIVLSVNPLTKLPGNETIIQEINKRISMEKIFSIGYLDIDKFKAYNDVYGFVSGDKVILFTAKILREIVEQQNGFVGHIGGDDFVFIIEEEQIKPVCEQIIKQFDTEIKSFYKEEDIIKGYIITEDRDGTVKNFPLMSVSIAIVTNKEKKITHIGEIMSIVSDLKKYLKSQPGSKYLVDRRKQ